MASPSPASTSCPTSPGVRDSVLELVATGHGKPAAGAHEEGGEVESAMEEQTTGSHPVKTPVLSESEKQFSSAPAGTGTGDAAAATPPSSLRCCGIPSAASTPPASAPRPTSPRVHCGGSTPMASPSPISTSCPTSPRVGESVPEQVATGHGKPAAGAHEREGVVASVMEQATGSDLVKTTVLSNSEKQSQQEKDLDPREGKLNQWEQDLDGRAEEVEQREDAAMQREKLQYDRWLRLAEWETDLRRAHHAVLQGHARLSKWVNDVDAEWTARMTTAPTMEDELRSEKSRLEAKEKEEEKGGDDEDKEQENEEVKHAHGCFGSGFFRRNCGGCAEPREEASAALKQRLLMPQQSQSMPTPSDTPNPVIAEITAMPMRTSTPKAKVYQLETCFMAPGLDQSTSESNDPEMVKIGLRVLTRSSENLDERRLYSTIHEILKAVVAKYNATQLITEQERVRWEIRKILTDRAQNFGIAIDDVSIVSLSFEKVFTQDIEEKEVTTQEAVQDNRTTQEAEQDNRKAMIRSQEDDQIWNKRQIGYIFDLGTALGIIFLIRPWLPSGYDRWILAAFAAIWGAGSVGLPIGMFGTSRLEKNCSRHVGRFISLSFSLLVIYAIYILTLNVAGTPPTPSVSSFGITDGDADADADWWTTLCFSVIAALVSFGHLCSWIRGCCTGGDRDTWP